MQIRKQPQNSPQNDEEPTTSTKTNIVEIKCHCGTATTRKQRREKTKRNIGNKEKKGRNFPVYIPQHLKNHKISHDVTHFPIGTQNIFKKLNGSST